MPAVLPRAWMSKKGVGPSRQMWEGAGFLFWCYTFPAIKQGGHTNGEDPTHCDTGGGC